jgi:uncharacterized protein YcbX
MLKVSQLLYYPIKSLPGISTAQMHLQKRGPAFDRRMMLIDENHIFLSQRKYPKLSILKLKHKNHSFFVCDPNGQLPELAIPEAPSEKGIPIEVQIWDDVCSVIAFSEKASQWFSEYLKKRVQLVYQPPIGIRKVDSRYGLPDDEVSLSDGYPYLITTTASLQKIKEWTGLAYSTERFRPNIVIDNQIAFEEDKWNTITIAEIPFRLPKKCARCKMINIDPKTAEINTEFSKLLAPYRTINNQLIFGKNACVNQYGAIINIGDQVEITNKNLQ